LAAAEGQRDAVPLESSAYGEYLAGLVAAHSQDYGTAADFMIRALDSDPDNVDLLRRAFVLTAAEGRHSESLELARRLVDQEPANAVALLVLAVDAVVRDQPDAAGDQLAAQPGSILYEPLLNAWLRVGAGDISGAQKNASGLDGREGFESLYLMHKALLYDVGDNEPPRPIGTCWGAWTRLRCALRSWPGISSSARANRRRLRKSTPPTLWPTRTRP
jgi:tetratricopeptide (TPR) repeat protein